MIGGPELGSRLPRGLRCHSTFGRFDPLVFCDLFDQKEAAAFEDRMRSEQSEVLKLADAFKLQIELGGTPKQNFQLIQDNEVQTLLVDPKWSLDHVLQV